MALTGDRYVGAYEGHTIELVRNNWSKTLRLLIDGREVARASRILPHDIVLTGALTHEGVEHSVVAKSIVQMPTAADTIEVDGQALPLTKTK